MPSLTVRPIRTRTARRAITNTITIAIALATAVSAPASAATNMYLELGPVKGESAERGAARGKVELSSFTFSASRKGWDGTIKGNPKAAASDSSAGAGAGGADKFGAVSGAHRDDDVAGASGTGTGSGKVSMQDMSVMRATPADGGQVAVGDTASGMPTGKRQHQPKGLAKPLDRGSVTVMGNLPGCTVGAAYADAVLQTPTERFEFTDAIITSCTLSGSTGGDDRPTESISLNYAKVIVRGWNPEKKEE